MSISKAIRIASAEENPNPHGTCNACERSGLPILLLREAYAPHPRDTQTYLVAHGSEITQVLMRSDQLRTLRQGYVYVLLDQEIWQAYQVTPEGALRRFPLSQPPRVPGRPLAKVCRTKNHDVIASFINIDTTLYQKAWIAFANDPWPRDVLDRYRDGIISQRPDFIDRFVELDLNTARNDPASLGIAMTAGDLGLDEVLEYGTQYPGNYTSAHGFYPRMARLAATRGFVRTTVLQEQLPNGVLALTVPDPVGLAMEANAQRTQWFQRMQEWRAEPQRHFEYFTSQALLGIRELNEARAAAQAVVDTAEEAENRKQWNENPIGFKAYLPPVDVEAQTERATQDKQQEARDRLEERYDEKARAAFQAHYDREVEHWQRMIDKVGELYANFYGHLSFQRIGYFDYSATDPLSIEYFIQMLSACLAGGPTERLPEDGAPLGPTQYLWQQLLEDHNSLLYQALTAKNQSLQQQLVKALSGDDLTYVYHAVKGMATSPEGERLMIKPVQDAIGLLLAGMANAGNALGKHVTERTRSLIGHVHSSAFLLFAGQPITQVRLSLTLGEYMSLLNEVLQERTDAFLGHLDKDFRRPAGRKVRAMVLSGAIHLAAAGNRSQLIEVMVWTLESAESLQARLTQLRDSAAGGAETLIRNASIGADTLRYSLVSAADDVKIGAAAARAIASDALRGLRTAASSPNSAKLLLALGSLWFQQETLRKNFDMLLETIPSNPEALAAIGSSTLGVVGVGIEATGLMLDLVRPEKILNGTITPLSLGQAIVRFGGAVTALAGSMDAVQYLHSASRAEDDGDSNASHSYLRAGAIAMLSAAAGVYAAVVSSAFLGPLGIAIVLGLAAYAFASDAKHEESSFLELWARRSRWGLPVRSRRWMSGEYLDAAVTELNAAVLGMQADTSIGLRLKSPDVSTFDGIVLKGDAIDAGFYLELLAHLPNFTKGASRFAWDLKLYRASRSRMDVHLWGDSSSPDAIMGLNSGVDDIFVDASPSLISKVSPDKTLKVRGDFALYENHGITAIEFEIRYWPDELDEAGLAVITVREDAAKTERGMSNA